MRHDDATRRQLLSTLRTAARKLLLARTAEAAAVCAAVAGLCAAAIELAWMIADTLRPLSAAICACSAVVIAAAAATPAARRRGRIDRLLAIVAAGVCLAAAGAGAAVILAGLHGQVPRALLPVIILPAGAVAGAAAALSRGVSLRAAAAYLDMRAGLFERLSTAAELAESEHRDAPAARFLYGQALDVVGKSGLPGRLLWRRTRATPGVLGLVVILCAAMALLPAFEESGVVPRREPVAVSRPAAMKLVRLPANIDAAGLASLAQMPAERRAVLADALRRAAEAETDPERAKAMREAAAAVEAGDAASLEKTLEALASAGALVPSAVADALGGPGTVGPPENLRRRVAVYNPAYAAALAGAKGPGQAEQAVTPAGQGSVPRDDAWAEARRRAQEALAVPRRIPAEYRQLVRDFFLAGR